MRSPDRGRGPPEKRERPALAGTGTLEITTNGKDATYSASARKWEQAVFGIASEGGQRIPRTGSVWRTWGIHRTSAGWYRVIHLPSGAILTEFNVLRIARRFCEAIDPLTDWAAEQPSNNPDPDLLLAVHREALRLTGARPELRVVGGGQ
jgi:hypothetical protein